MPETTVDPARGAGAPGFTPEGGDEHKRLNAEAMEAVVRAAEVRKVRRVVYCSSWSAYGRMSGIFDEEAPNNAHEVVPLGLCGGGTPVPYFECKRDCERVQAMLAGGVSANVRMAYGETLLSCAIAYDARSNVASARREGVA